MDMPTEGAFPFASIEESLDSVAAELQGFGVEMEVLKGQAAGTLPLDHASGVLALAAKFDAPHAWMFLEFLRGWQSGQGVEIFPIQGLDTAPPELQEASQDIDPQEVLKTLNENKDLLAEELRKGLLKAGASEAEAAEAVDALMAGYAEAAAETETSEAAVGGGAAAVGAAAGAGAAAMPDLATVQKEIEAAQQEMLGMLQTEMKKAGAPQAEAAEVMKEASKPAEEAPPQPAEPVDAEAAEKTAAEANKKLEQALQQEVEKVRGSAEYQRGVQQFGAGAE